MLTLAQTSVPMLPEPPWWEVALFEKPLFPAILIVILSLLAFFVLHRAGRSRAALLVLMCVPPLAGALLIVAGFVTTTREHVLLQTRSLIRAAAEADIETLSSLLASDAVILLRSTPAATGKERVLGVVRSTTGSATPVSDPAIIRQYAAANAANAAQTQVWVRVTYAGVPNRSWWRLSWRPSDSDPDRWLATSLDLLEADGLSDPRSLHLLR